MTAWLTSLAVLLFVCFPSDASGSAISFQSSSSSFKPLMSGNLTLTCSLHDTSPAGAVVRKRLTSLPEGEALADDVITGKEEETQTDDKPDDLDDPTISKKSLTRTTDNIKSVTSMIISRDGHHLATLSEHFPVRQAGSGCQVSGQLTAETGSLELVLPHPTQADAGTYRCDVAAVNRQGQTVVFSQTLDVSVDDVSMNDLVSHLHKIELEKEEMAGTIVDMKKADDVTHKNMERLDETIRTMSTTIGTQENTIGIMNKTIGDQTTSIGLMNQTIGIMKTQNSALKQSLDALRNTARFEPSVFFSALLTTSQLLSYDQAVIYDNVFSNEGAAYSNTTGTFTCPVDGFYHFEFHTYSVSGASAYLALEHNGYKVVSASNYGGGDRGTSNSVTLKLTKDDRVNVVCILGNSYLYYDMMRLANTFSGNLMSLV